MTLEQRQTDFIELFNSLGSWQERFQYLIEIGNDLPSMPVHLKTPSNKIESCTSQTYIHISTTEGRLHIEGWSNASIPSGMIMLLINIFEGVDLADLKQTKINFQIETDLINNLTGQRRAALYEMIHRVVRI